MQFFSSLATGAGAMPQTLVGGPATQTPAPVAGLFAQIAASALGEIAGGGASDQVKLPTAEEGEVNGEAAKSPDPSARPAQVDASQKPVMPLAPPEVLPEGDERGEAWERQLLPTSQEISATDEKPAGLAPRADFVPLAALGLLGSLDASREEAPPRRTPVASGTPGTGTGWVAGGDAAARFPHPQATIRMPAVAVAADPQTQGAEQGITSTAPGASFVPTPPESTPVLPDAVPRTGNPISPPPASIPVERMADIQSQAPARAEPALEPSAAPGAPATQGLPQRSAASQAVAVEFEEGGFTPREPIGIRIEGELPRQISPENSRAAQAPLLERGTNQTPTGTEPAVREDSGRAEQWEVRASARGLADLMPESEGQTPRPQSPGRQPEGEARTMPPRTISEPHAATRSEVQSKVDAPTPRPVTADARLAAEPRSFAAPRSAPAPDAQPRITPDTRKEASPDSRPNAGPRSFATPRSEPMPEAPARTAPALRPQQPPTDYRTEAPRAARMSQESMVEESAEPRLSPPRETESMQPKAQPIRRSPAPQERVNQESVRSAMWPTSESTTARSQAESTAARPLREPVQSAPQRTPAPASPHVARNATPHVARNATPHVARNATPLRGASASPAGTGFVALASEVNPSQSARPMSARGTTAEHPVRTTAPEVQQKLDQAAMESFGAARSSGSSADLRAQARETLPPGASRGEQIHWDAQRSARIVAPPVHRPASERHVPTQDQAAPTFPRAAGEAEQVAVRPIRPWWLRGPGEIAAQRTESVIEEAASRMSATQRGGERVQGVQVPTGQPVSAGRPGIEEPEGVSSWRPVTELTDEPTLKPSPPRDATSNTMPRAEALTDSLARGARMAGRGEALGSDLVLPPKVAAVSSQTAYWIRSSFRMGRRESVVTLDPPELGRMRISLRQEGSQLTARIQTELPEVATILREGADAIRERLEGQGLRIDTLVIESVGNHRAERPAAADASQGQSHSYGDLGADAQERRDDSQQTARPAPQSTAPDREAPTESATDEAQAAARSMHRVDLRA